MSELGQIEKYLGSLLDRSLFYYEMPGLTELWAKLAVLWKS